MHRVPLARPCRPRTCVRTRPSDSAGLLSPAPPADFSGGGAPKLAVASLDQARSGLVNACSSSKAPPPAGCGCRLLRAAPPRLRRCRCKPGCAHVASSSRRPTQMTSLDPNDIFTKLAPLAGAPPAPDAPRICSTSAPCELSSESPHPLSPACFSDRFLPLRRHAPLLRLRLRPRPALPAEPRPRPPEPAAAVRGDPRGRLGVAGPPGSGARGRRGPRGPVRGDVQAAWRARRAAQGRDPGGVARWRHRCGAYSSVA